ncbi:MAG: 3-oxoadipate enol-lactonase [Solirubrobacteraceae bacterium]
MQPLILNYESSGPQDAPVLLLGGGLGTNLTMWREQVQALASTHRVIPFDHRGHGRSFTALGPYSIDDLGRDVLALIDHLGIERVSYAGLSIGAMVGIWLAANAPERLDRLILMGPSAYAPPSSRWLERAELVREAGTAAVVADAVVERWFTAAWADSHPAVVDSYRAMVVSTDAEGYAACCEAIAAMDLREQLGAISAATLVISAAEDLSLPPEHQRLIAERIAGARLATIQDAAHIVTAQQPDLVNRLIAEHLRS